MSLYASKKDDDTSSNMTKVQLTDDENGETSGGTPSSEQTETSGSVDESYLTASNTIADGFRFRSFDSTVSEAAVQDDNMCSEFNIPIVGYEVTEEKAKFTVFKLKVENKSTGDCWFVFRRYTDFARLHSKLKAEFPHIKLPLPRKKWFGDNFNQSFLDERVDGLQLFVNSILKYREVCSSESTKSFFCLDEPPSYTDSLEESKAILEALEETVYHLRKQLKEKEIEHEKLKIAHSLEIESKLRLVAFIQESTKACTSCAIRLSSMDIKGSDRETS